MISADALVSHLAGLGVALKVEGDSLVYWPRVAVTCDLVELLRSHKAEVLAELRRRPRYGCWKCRGREFVRINRPPTHEWFCAGCQAPYPPEMVIERWTSPLESLRAPTKGEVVR